MTRDDALDRFADRITRVAAWPSTSSGLVGSSIPSGLKAASCAILAIA